MQYLLSMWPKNPSLSTHQGAIAQFGDHESIGRSIDDTTRWILGESEAFAIHLASRPLA